MASRTIAIALHLMILALWLPQPPMLAATIAAFPGAEGFGSHTPGGRGGRVTEVTNLNDTGAGSLRAALEADGPRIVVFRIGGTIQLDRAIEIHHPYLTVAGQTAPGGGITLRGSKEKGKDVEPLKILTHDVVLRYIRSRPGPTGEPSCCSSAIQLANGAKNVVVDHCSLSWAVDENVSVWHDAKNITIQWNIISEGLYHSTHEKGPHSKGALLGAKTATNFSLHHNLFAHNDDRNPRIKIGGPADVVNNVIYNARNSPGWRASHASANSQVNYVGNYFKSGSHTKDAEAYISGDGKSSFYVEGNIATDRASSHIDEAAEVVDQGSQNRVTETPFPTPPIAREDAVSAFEAVLSRAGSSAAINEKGKWVRRRDRVDQRVTREVRRGSGRIIDDPAQVGGWPQLDAGSAPLDTDHDGMPDVWEAMHGLDAASDDSADDRDGDGYTNVEEYINGTDPRE